MTQKENIKRSRNVILREKYQNTTLTQKENSVDKNLAEANEPNLRICLCIFFAFEVDQVCINQLIKQLERGRCPLQLNEKSKTAFQ